MKFDPFLVWYFELSVFLFLCGCLVRYLWLKQKEKRAKIDAEFGWWSF